MAFPANGRGSVDKSHYDRSVISLISQGRNALSLVSRSRRLSADEQVIDSCRFTERVGNDLEEEIVNAFDPNALPIKIWHQAQLVCLLYELYMLPYFLAFETDFAVALSTEWGLIFVAEFLFLVDFYVQAHTGYYFNGDVIRDKKKTRRKYVTFYGFVLDAIAIIPISSTGIKTRLPRALLEMHKVIRYWRMGKYVATLDDVYAKYFALVKLLKVVVFTFYMSHFVACVRYWFGYNSHEVDDWLPDVPEFELSIERKYLMSFFWAFGLLSGLFEGELPYTIPEFVFTIGVAICGFSLFTTLCAMFFMISKCESAQTEIVEARINQLKHLLSFHNVSEHLQTQAVDYLRRYCSDDDSSDREALKNLCPSIVVDIQIHLMKDTVANIPLFSGCSDHFLIALTSLLQMIAIPAQYKLCEAGDLGDAMYIVYSGVLNIMINSVKVREMRKGMCFGEISIFTQSPRTASAVSVTYCLLYRLSRSHSERVLAGYPECATNILASANAFLHKAKHHAHIHSSMGSATSITSTRSSREKKSSSNSENTRPKSIRRKISLAGGVPIAFMLKSLVDQRWRSRIKRGTVVPTNSDSHDSVELSAIADSQEDEEIDMPEGLKGMWKHYDSGTSQDSNSGKPWWYLLLLKNCLEAESTYRLYWIAVLDVTLVYNWVIVPLRLVFPLLHRSGWYFTVFDAIADLVLYLDIYGNFSLSFTVNAEVIRDPVRIARRYMSQNFVFDLICTFPYTAMMPSHQVITRVPRLCRVWRLTGHLTEVNQQVHLTSRRWLLLMGFLFVMLYHLIACLHFSITKIEGFSNEEDAWIPCDDIYLREINESYFEIFNHTIYPAWSSIIQEIGAQQYFRSLYYATNVLAALGETIEPNTIFEYKAALVLMFSGFVITAIVVDNVQKRFTASALEQKEFVASRARIQQFLKQQNAPLQIYQRVNSLLDFLWSAHRGAVISEILGDLPLSIKHDILRSICSPVLQTLALLAGVRPVIEKLEIVVVDNVQFILYGQGEVVYRQGDYATGIFFLLEGSVCVITNGSDTRSVSVGGFFGTAALTQHELGDGYGEHVSATSGCILLYASREHLHAMESIFPGFSKELVALEMRLRSHKFAKTQHVGGNNQASGSSRSELGQSSRSIFSKLSQPFVFDPDSPFILAWETLLFFLMTLQWITLFSQICFRINKMHHVASDALSGIIELVFFTDMYIRSRLGYYAYGNKVMDLRKIRRTYFLSLTFCIDILALLPLYIVNWVLPTGRQIDLMNINKLLRVFKVPTQLHTLETRYLKLTLELRIFKLLYYIFLLSHIFGCLWFNFASHAATGNVTHGSHETSFGKDKWLPPENLENASFSEQYFASLFWAFGLMSASSTGKLPKSSYECIFSVITMTSGFFLFAYVIGNFSDILELSSADASEFHGLMGSVRRMISYFQIPTDLADSLKTYLFFKHYHVSTSEYKLERYLPPSLITDIRLVHLKHMIEKVEFLSGMEGPVTRMLVSQFKQLLIPRDQFVCKYGEEGSDMFFVFSGILDILMPPDVSPSNEGTWFTSGTNPLNPELVTPPKNVGVSLIKINEVTAGSYFGENGLFTKSLRNAFVRAQTSCILYKLSRESLELVFERYPGWKRKVLNIANIQQEQQRLTRLSQEQQQCSAFGTGSSILSQLDLINEKAELLEENLQLVRIRRTGKASNTIHPIADTSFIRACEKHLGYHVTIFVRTIANGTQAQSSFHIRWLKFMVVCTLFIAIVVPYRIALDSMTRSAPLATIVKSFELLAELMFMLDIWIHWQLKESIDSMELYEQNHRVVYTKENLVWDMIAAIPLHHLLSDITVSLWLRPLRCFKVVNLVTYVQEINRRSISTEFNRLLGVFMLYALSIYWVACAYLTIPRYSGYGDEWNAWRPSVRIQITDPDHPSYEQLILRFLRGAFYGTTVFVKKGKNFTPEVTSHYIFSLCASCLGLLVMSLVISEVASIYISYIGIEIDFRRQHIAVEKCLARLKVSEDIRKRTHAFMSARWSSHVGVNYDIILDQLPLSIRTECKMHISEKPIMWFVSSVFQPICWEAKEELQEFARSITEHLQLEDYPRNENVILEGNISRAMYFVVKGHLSLQSNSISALNQPAKLRKGDYFGERGLIGCTVNMYTVQTKRACDLLSLSSEALLIVIQKHVFSRLAFVIVQQAYKRLKTTLLTYQSVQDMRNHWGKAIFQVLLDTKAALGGGTRSVTDMPFDGLEELPSQINVMFRALSDPIECFQAFHGFINIIASSDPMNWHATFESKHVQHVHEGLERTSSIHKDHQIITTKTPEQDTSNTISNQQPTDTISQAKSNSLSQQAEEDHQLQLSSDRHDSSMLAKIADDITVSADSNSFTSHAEPSYVEAHAMEAFHEEDTHFATDQEEEKVPTSPGLAELEPPYSPSINSSLEAPSSGAARGGVHLPPLVLSTDSLDSLDSDNAQEHTHNKAPAHSGTFVRLGFP